MGNWSEEIYGNDIAQDTLVRMEKSYKKLKSIDAVLKEIKGSSLYSYCESKFVVADFEIDTLGTLSNSDEVTNALHSELSEDGLSYWNEPNVRKLELEKFKIKLALGGKSVKVCNSNYINILEWFQNKRNEDIFNKKK